MALRSTPPWQSHRAAANRRSVPTESLALQGERIHAKLSGCVTMLSACANPSG